MLLTENVIPDNEHAGAINDIARHNPLPSYPIVLTPRSGEKNFPAEQNVDIFQFQTPT